MLPNKMDVCYLLVYVQEIRIQPYFCVKQGDYFFPLFAKDPVYVCVNFKSLLRSGKPSYQSCPTDHSSFMSCGMVLECWLGNFVGQHRKYNIFDIYTLTMLHIS